MKKQLISISVLQSSKIMTAMYAALGLIYTLLSIPMMIFGNGTMKIVGFVYFFMPIVMGVFGFIFFVIFASIYNLLAAKLGGFEVEIQNMESAQIPGSPPKI